MKVLIISHNPLGDGTNMGNTLQAWFRGFSSEKLAQFYIRGKAPDCNTLCQNHYRFTDVDALEALTGWNPVGKKNDTAVKAAYRYGRKRSALSYLLRDILWKRDPWDTAAFWQWAERFGPDVIFLASGDHGFLYDMAAKVAARMKKPLAVACVDDYYLHNSWEGDRLGKLARVRFLGSVRRAMEGAQMLFAICPSMAREYETLFGRKCRVLHTPANGGQAPAEEGTRDVVYLGNVSLKRREELIRIGKLLKKLDLPDGPKRLQVYSAEQDIQMLAGLTEENGICFHGAVKSEKAGEILRTALAAVHVESFNPQLRSRLRFSVSTKIPQILAQGPCLIAWGPQGIASMDYLMEHEAACVITDPTEAEETLRKLLTDAALRQTIQARGRALAAKNHSPGVLRKNLEELLENIK